MKPLGLVERFPVVCEFDDGPETVELLSSVDFHLDVLIGDATLWADADNNVYIGKELTSYFLVRRKEDEHGRMLGELWSPVRGDTIGVQ